MDDFITNVYLTLQGQLVEPVEGVEDIFFPGSKCEYYLFEMRDAYTRIGERLGEGKEDDADVEMIIFYLSRMSEELGRWMYHYGHKFSGRQI